MVTPRTHTQRTDVSGVTFVSGQIKTTAAGGGGVASDVSIAGVAISGGKIAVTSPAAAGVAVSVPRVTGKVAVSLESVAISGNKLGVDLPGVAISGGKIAVTSPAAAGVAVSSVLVTGQPIAVSAAGGSIGVSVKNQADVSAHGQVSAQLLGIVDDASTVSAGEGGATLLRATSGRALHVAVQNQPRVGLSGVNTTTSALNVHVQNQPRVGLSGVNTTTSGLNVHVQNQPRVGLSGVNIANSALETFASIKAVAVSGNKLAVDLPGVNTSGGKVLTTAAGGGTNVAITNISGDVRITAGNAPIPVTLAAQPIAVSAAGGSIGVSVKNTPNVAITNISGDVRVTAGNTPLPVLASISGDVKISAGASPIPVTVAAQPLAVSAAAGVMPVGIRGDAIYNATVSNPIKFAEIDVAAAACANVVASVAARKIRVLSYNLISAGTVQATWISTSPYTEFSGGMNLARGVAMPFCPVGYFETSAGNALSLRLGAAVSVGGHLVYQEVH